MEDESAVLETEMGEEAMPYERPKPKYYEPLYLCKCLLDGDSIVDETPIPPRKLHVLSTVARTEHYLRERRIPELIRFLLTQLISHAPAHPMEYLEKLLDDCMLFRARLGVAPVLYEMRHLEAVVKSFDPGERGWLTASQVRKAFGTLGLTVIEPLAEKILREQVICMLESAQENELFDLLSAGTEVNKQGVAAASYTDSTPVSNNSHNVSNKFDDHHPF